MQEIREDDGQSMKTVDVARGNQNATQRFKES